MDHACVAAYAAADLAVVPIATASKTPVSALLPQVCDWPRRPHPRTGLPDAGRGRGAWAGLRRAPLRPDEIAAIWGGGGAGAARGQARRTWAKAGDDAPDAATQAAILAEPLGVAVITGSASGGLLVYDVDEDGFLARWAQAIAALLPASRDLGDGTVWAAHTIDGVAIWLPAAMYVQRTGGGGYQGWVRCADPGRSTPLAWQVARDDRGHPRRDVRGKVVRRIAIETRAEGSQAVAAPSLHPSGRRYVALAGSALAIPTIGMASADLLRRAAIACDETPAEDHPAPPRPRAAAGAVPDGESVIARYNAATPIGDRLAELGYTFVGGDLWARPGGRRGTVWVKDNKSLHFNTSDPLCDNHWHTPFDLLCDQQCGGDVRRAVREAAQQLGIAHERPARAVGGDTAPHPAGDGAVIAPARTRASLELVLFAPDDAAHRAPDGPPDAPPPDDGPQFRSARRDRPAVGRAPQWTGDIDAVRDRMREIIIDYLAEERPDEVLLIRIPPGGGKTSLSVEVSEFLAQPYENGRQPRVAYYGPRHTLFTDLMGAAQHPQWWHEWQSRHRGDPVSGDGATCLHAAPKGKGDGSPMGSWLHRGHEAMAFCAQICGWSYIKDGCAYHAQKRTSRPILYLQHQHLWAGVPEDLHATVAFGDELPLGAMLWQWEIPARFVVPPEMPIDEPVTELLHALHTACRDQGATRLTGPALLDALGGAGHVATVIDDYESRKASLPDGLPSVADRAAARERARARRIQRRRSKAGGKRRRAPDEVRLRHAAEAHEAPFRHLRDLLWHLRREARAHLAGAAYEARVVAGHDQLILLQRRTLHPSVPRHLIWLDGTGDPTIYAAILGRPIRVVTLDLPLKGRVMQVVSRAYGKRSLLATTTPETPPPADEARGADTPDTPDAPPPAPSPAPLTRQGDEAIGLIQTIVDRHGYARPGLISFQGVTAQVGARFHAAAHFYGARGSNAFTDRADGPGVDALFVLGTPLPDPYALRTMAAMLYLERMAPFDLTWSDRMIPYAYVDASGDGWSYPVSNFWREPALMALVQQVREMEIVQAAERARLRLREVDVWLLLNVPLADLPPTQILTTADILRGGETVPADPYRWAQFVALADRCHAEGVPLGAGRIAKALGVAASTARRYLAHLQATQPDRWAPQALAPVGRGRPAQALAPMTRKASA